MGIECTSFLGFERLLLWAWGLHSSDVYRLYSYFEISRQMPYYIWYIINLVPYTSAIIYIAYATFYYTSALNRWSLYFFKSFKLDLIRTMILGYLGGKLGVRNWGIRQPQTQRFFNMQFGDGPKIGYVLQLIVSFEPFVIKCIKLILFKA